MNVVDISVFFIKQKTIEVDDIFNSRFFLLLLIYTTT